MRGPALSDVRRALHHRRLASLLAALGMLIGLLTPHAMATVSAPAALAEAGVAAPAELRSPADAVTADPGSASPAPAHRGAECGLSGALLTDSCEVPPVITAAASGIPVRRLVTVVDRSAAPETCAVLDDRAGRTPSSLIALCISRT